MALLSYVQGDNAVLYFVSDGMPINELTVLKLEHFMPLLPINQKSAWTQFSSFLTRNSLELHLYEV